MAENEIKLNICYGCMGDLPEGQQVCPSCGYDNNVRQNPENALPEGTVLLEIKTALAMPLWLADALDAEKLYPGSFSKYGAAYTRGLEQKKNPILITKGEDRNVVNL